MTGHHEKLPYDHSALRSAYHIREYDVLKLSLVRPVFLLITVLKGAPQLSRPDIFLSHDWPQGIEHHGNLNHLLQRKSFFKADIDSGRLGSPPMMTLLRKLQPKRWFSAHLHVRYEAAVHHGHGAAPVPQNQVADVANPDEIVMDDIDDEPVSRNPDEIVLDDADDEAHAPNPDEIAVEEAMDPSTSHNPDEITLDDLEPTAPSVFVDRPASPQGVTQFLALDKCLPRRSFLEVSIPDYYGRMNANAVQIVDIRSPVPVAATGPVITYDPEWLAISKALHPFLSTSRAALPIPSEETARALVDKERDWIAENAGALEIADVQVFTKTAPNPLPKQARARGQQR